MEPQLWQNGHTKIASALMIESTKMLSTQRILTTTRRRVLLLTLAVALVLLAVGGWLFVSAQIRTVQPGMTYDQVKAILGPPRGGMAQFGWMWLNYGDGNAETVVTFTDGVVTSVDRPTLFERLRRRLGL
jgi:hypothetical protein